jgi:hypothetical protein
MLKYRPSRSLIIGLLCLALTGGAAVASLSALPKTKTLRGRLLNIANFVGPGCVSDSGVCSSFQAIGDISGDGIVSVATFPTFDVPGYTTAHTVIHTKKGDLRCTEAALFDLVGPDHAFVDECIITGGTGIYEGATGYIQEVGTFDFVKNLGEADYYGKITFAQPE